MKEIKHPLILSIFTSLKKILQGKDEAIKLALICFFSKGHLLIEDLPGVGKTLMALGLARITNLSFSRIQCTSDLLPSDILGVTIYNQRTKEFEFKAGPIFNNVVLVDEINRTMPKTQSALLEAMGERQITVDGKTYPLPEPFFLIATQNPIEFHGTFPLPESQLDRFTMKINIGYPERNALIEILKKGDEIQSLKDFAPITNREEILKLQREVENIFVSDKIYNYIVDIAETIKNNPNVAAAPSIRAMLQLLLCAKTNALFKNREFVIPEDVKELAPHIIAHRLIVNTESLKKSRKELVKLILEEVPVPV